MPLTLFNLDDKTCMLTSASKERYFLFDHLFRRRSSDVRHSRALKAVVQNAWICNVLVIWL